MNNGDRRITKALALALAAPTVALGIAACGKDAVSESPDFVAADLEGLSLNRADLPEMEYQAEVSGPGAFAAEQREQAEEEGDNGGLQLVTRLEKVGLEADYATQFFATSRDSDLLFAASTAFLFGDVASAQDAIRFVSEANADNLDSSEPVETPDLGEQPFGVRGKFDGFPTYSFGWRLGDAIQVVTVAPGDPRSGPEIALELAEQVVAKGTS